MRAALLSALALLSCARPEGGVHVVVSGPLEAGTDFDRLTAVAALPDGRALGVQTLEGDALHPLPASFNFVSGPGTPAGTQVAIAVHAERAGEVVSSARGDAELRPGQGAVLTLELAPLPLPSDSGAVREACNNRFDDDGDNDADCADAECAGATCHVGGMSCLAGACGCPGGLVGGLIEYSGFTPRVGARAARITGGPKDGWLALASGSVAYDTVEWLEPNAGTLQQSTLLAARASAVLVATPGGGLLVVGGRSAAGAPRSDYERFDDGGFTLELAASPFVAVDTFAAMQSDEAVFAGGVLGLASGGTSGASALWMSLDGGVVTGPVSLSAAHGGAGARLRDDKILLAGGPAGTPTARTDLLLRPGVVSAGPLIQDSSGPVMLSAPAMAPTQDGRAVILGGERVIDGGAVVPSDQAFIAEALGGAVTIRELRRMLGAKARPRAVLAGNGWIYVEDEARLSPPEWLDPASERFVPASSPNPQRVGYALAGLETPAVILAGGAVDGGIPDVRGYVMNVLCP